MRDSLVLLGVFLGLVFLIALAAHSWPGRRIFFGYQRRRGAFIAPRKRTWLFAAEFLGALFASCLFLALTSLTTEESGVKFLLTVVLGYLGALAGALLYSLWLFRQPKKFIMF